MSEPASPPKPPDDERPVLRRVTSIHGHIYEPKKPYPEQGSIKLNAKVIDLVDMVDGALMGDMGRGYGVILEPDDAGLPEDKRRPEDRRYLEFVPANQGIALWATDTKFLELLKAEQAAAARELPDGGGEAKKEDDSESEEEESDEG